MMPPDGSARSSTLRRLVIVAAFAAPILFALVTNHVWEDYYITLRSSRNLIEGHGLVFQPGERVHTFTSPIGVLLPAFFLWISGGRESVAIWIFRIAGAALLSAAAGIAWRRLERQSVGGIGKLVFFGLMLFDPKLTDFATNGQETAILVFLVIVLWNELERAEGPRPVALALAYGGMMWTRPDAFILAGALTLPCLWSPGAAVSAKRLRVASLVRGIAGGIALYLPWFLWAWHYYGSPIPNTILAKATQTHPLSLSDLIATPLHSVAELSMLDYLFLPANFMFGGWPRELNDVSHVLAVIAVLAWIAPGLPAPGRRASFALFVGSFYFCSIVLFAWYVPPWSALAWIVCAHVADSAHRSMVQRKRDSAAGAVRIAALLAVAGQLALFIAVSAQMRTQQRLVEDGGRRRIGEWLRATASPADTVFLEPLGYIGYFSGLKTYDYPGLSSREVVTAIRNGAFLYSEVVQRLQPTWLVLRPYDLEKGGFPADGRIQGYRLVRTFDVRPQIDAIEHLPGRAWLEFDATFLIYRRLD